MVRASGAQPSICISTDTDDRGGNVLDLRSAAVNYQRHPVVLAFHSDEDSPVGVTTSLDVTTNGEIATWKWLEEDDRAAGAFRVFPWPMG